MKILFIANAIFGVNPGLSGGEIRFIEIAKSWAAQGHQIHLMSSRAGKTLCERLNLKIIFHNISDSKKIGRLAFIQRALKSAFFLPDSLKDFDEGIIYSTNEMLFDVMPALRLKLKNRKKIKWAAIVHWLPPFPPWKRKKTAIFNATLFFISERMSVWLSNWFADILLPVSLMTAGQLSAVGADMKKVYPVECGVNYTQIKDIAKGVKEKKYDAVFMKRLQAVKGIFDLIDIWEIVVKAKPDARLLVIGEGIDGEKAKEMAELKKLDKNIEFTGVIYDIEEKITKLAESRLFLLPTYEENWAIVMGEAMVTGIPVIAYGLKELIDVWKDNFILVPVGNKEAFAEKIMELLNRPETLDEIARKPREYVKQYDWNIIAEKELNIILDNGINDQA